MTELEQLANWDRTFTEPNVDEAIQAASAAGHAESAAWLLARHPRRTADRTSVSAADDLDDLLL
jgi:hypothetical protein